jgi:SGNH hydrolase-like domain, acetyltransferase AlgX
MANTSAINGRSRVVRGRWGSLLSTGRLIPAVLTIAALADATTRGLPIDAFTFRAWEALTYYRRVDTVFEPNRQFDKRAYGDLANLGNLARLRVYRRETFTTDAYGFRNPHGLAESGRVKALLIGDSFAAGAGVADQYSLAAQLTDRSVPTFAVAPMLLTATATQNLAHRLGMSEGWILFEQASGLRYLYVETLFSSTIPSSHKATTFRDRFTRNLNTGVWPLRMGANSWLKVWQDDRWFANPYKNNVTVRRLINGDTMIFLPGEHTIEPDLSAVALNAIEATVGTYRKFSAGLGETGLRLVVILVPDRFSAYAHLLAEDPWLGAMPPYLRELERRLRDAGIAVVNLYPALAARATQEAAEWRYVYWRDDSHWNERGIATAADVVAEYLGSEGRRPPATVDDSAPPNGQTRTRQ